MKIGVSRDPGNSGAQETVSNRFCPARAWPAHTLPESLLSQVESMTMPRRRSDGRSGFSQIYTPFCRSAFPRTHYVLTVCLSPPPPRARRAAGRCWWPRENAHHHPSSPTIANPRQPSPIIANHRQSSPIIANHRQPSPIIANYRQSPPLIANHRQSSPIVANHHQSWQLRRSRPAPDKR